MKKLLLALAAAGIGLSASAQDEQYSNSIFVYANLGFQMNTPADNSIGSTNRTIQWNAYPGIGYQLNNHWAVGVNLGWSQYATRLHVGASKDSSTTQNNYQVGPFVRYANSIMGSKTFFWYTQLNLYYLGGYSTSESIPSFDKHHGFGASLMPAFGINLGNQWCLNFAIGGVEYYTDKMNAVAGVTSGSDKNLLFTLGQSYSVGISKYFGGGGHHMKSHNDMGEDHTSMPDTSDDSGNGGKKKSRKDDDE